MKVKELLIDKAEVRKDRHLRWMMRAGIPIAIIALLSLWLGQTFSSPLLGLVFLFTMPVALVLGFAYNIRFLTLAYRRRKANAESKR